MIITTDTPSTPKEAAQLHPFVQCYKEHGTATYLILSGKDRRLEREYAHLAGDWRHPACGEDLPLMDPAREGRTGLRAKVRRLMQTKIF